MDEAILLRGYGELHPCASEQIMDLGPFPAKHADHIGVFYYAFRQSSETRQNPPHLYGMGGSFWS